MIMVFRLVFLFLAVFSFAGMDFSVNLYAANKGQTEVQTKCPVMGGSIDKDIYTDYKGTRVYLGGKMCLEMFKKDPEKYMKILKNAEVGGSKPHGTSHGNMH